MSDSLQQQLIQAGLVSQERAEELNKPKPKRPPRNRTNAKGGKNAGAKAGQGKKGPPREQRPQNKRPAQSQNAKKAAKAEQEAKAEAELAAKRELKAKIKTLIEENSVTEFTGELTFSYVVGDRIRQLFVTQEFLDKISAGELAITRLNRQTHLVTPEVAEQLLALNPQWLVVVNDPSKEQPTLESTDDPYAEYKVPDDLHW